MDTMLAIVLVIAGILMFASAVVLVVAILAAFTVQDFEPLEPKGEVERKKNQSKN